MCHQYCHHIDHKIQWITKFVTKCFTKFVTKYPGAPICAKHSQHTRSQGYEVRSNLKNFTVEAEEQELYCLQYMVASASSMCREMPELASLRAGQEVCALCTSRGVQHRWLLFRFLLVATNLHFRPQPEGGLIRVGGLDGRISSFRLFLQVNHSVCELRLIFEFCESQFKMCSLQPRCSGTWRRKSVFPSCPCSSNSTFVFV